MTTEQHISTETLRFVSEVQLFLSLASNSPHCSPYWNMEARDKLAFATKELEKHKAELKVYEVLQNKLLLYLSDKA